MYINTIILYRDKVAIVQQQEQQTTTANNNNTNTNTTNSLEKERIQITLSEIEELAEQIRSYRSNLDCSDVTVIETSLKNGYGLLHLHNVCIVYV